MAKVTDREIWLRSLREAKARGSVTRFVTGAVTPAVTRYADVTGRIARLEARIEELERRFGIEPLSAAERMRRHRARKRDDGGT